MNVLYSSKINCWHDTVITIISTALGEGKYNHSKYIKKMFFKNLDINGDHYSTTMFLSIYAHIYNLTFLVLFPRHCVSFDLKRYGRKVLFCLVWVLTVVYLWFKGRQEKSVVGGNRYKVLVWKFCSLAGDLLSFSSINFLSGNIIADIHVSFSREILERKQTHTFIVTVLAICTKFLRDIHRCYFVFFLNKTSY